MTRHLLQKPLVTMLLALTIGTATLANSPTRHSTESLARRALAANGNESAKAVAELRSMGPEGLQAFLETNHKKLEAALKAIDSSTHLPAAGGHQVLAALDSICQQKDCHASRLYWHTDLDEARSAARASGKPILSLRLLGRLDEDLSCANSRLFRITLYANEQVSQLLRERFVLHWQTVRPVPRLTIDFGDGRTMQRTLTGNSIHYVLDSEGRLIDALPGLYGPGAFLRELTRIHSTAATLNAFQTEEERTDALRRYHQTRLNELENSWLKDVKRAGLRVAPSREIPKPAGAGSSPPSASTAAAVAISKSVIIERPVLRGFLDDPKLLDSIGSDTGWSMIARLHAQDATLDQATLTLMSFKDPSLVSEVLQLATLALARAVAEDTVRNEYVFRARIHQWLASGSAGSDVETLNEKVYAELFLTPSWDEWLGLRPAGTYSGIDRDGIRK